MITSNFFVIIFFESASCAPSTQSRPTASETQVAPVQRFVPPGPQPAGPSGWAGTSGSAGSSLVAQSQRVAGHPSAVFDAPLRQPSASLPTAGEAASWHGCALPRRAEPCGHAQACRAGALRAVSLVQACSTDLPDS